jgi:excinuclease ABC subunit B
MDFKLVSEFKPTGDQPQAIKQLVNGLKNDVASQTLLGVTGSGKTFTAANVIKEVNRPTLILSHNKTLAAQLYGEFKQFFPDNAVEYFVSYYDYYQPEAYLPVNDTFIEKDLSINDEIEKLRLSTTSSLLSGRKDVIVISSVSCIYGIGNPAEFEKSIISVTVGQVFTRNEFLLKLVENLYSRSQVGLDRGQFRVKGDTVDIFLAYADYALRVVFWGDDIEELKLIDPISTNTIEELKEINIYPANIFVTSQDTINSAIDNIALDLGKQVAHFEKESKIQEAKRLQERVTYDLEMIKELGYCSGIENYSRYFDHRSAGSRPFCLIDYFPSDFLTIIDESHVTLPQIKAMYGGDRARKINLVDYGFRLPAAMDNRPLQFDEFQSVKNQTIYVSATPAQFELEESEGIIVEQVIRPTGLLDPIIDIRPTKNQIDDLLAEINERQAKDERVLITTLTKRMAEELTKYLLNYKVPTRYIHSEVDTMDRVEILRDLRLGEFDVLVGVNLLREGLDLPEVSLVIILDADKEGFLRSERSLTQTVGRAARNVNGKVIMYADKVTDSMRKTIDETNRRRKIQHAYNIENGITPTQIKKSTEQILRQTKVADGQEGTEKRIQEYNNPTTLSIAADPVVKYMSATQLKSSIEASKLKMETAAKNLDFIEAAKYRDEIQGLEQILNGKN